MRHSSVGFALALLVTASPIWAATIWATTTERHSGVIVAADPTQRTVTIEEMGPWHGPSTQPARRVFKLTPGTRIALAERTHDGNLGWPWAFTERALDPSDLRSGDWVTVTMESAGARDVAVQLHAVRPGSGTE